MEVPSSPADYQLDPRDAAGWPVMIDDASNKVVNETLLPAAHSLGITQADLGGIVDDVSKHPQTYESCERTSRNAWGANFDANLQSFREACADPKYAALFDQYESLSNSARLIVAITTAHQRRASRR
jgi:hypothetical protein